MKSNYLNSIAVVLFVLLLFCTKKGISQYDSIVKMRFTQISPNLSNAMKLESYDSTIIEVFDSNKIKYFQFQIPILIYDNSGYVKKEKRTQYFIQFKDSLTGYFTDSILGLINVKQNRDSIAVLNIAFNDALESDFKNLKMELVETETINSNNILIEKFRVFSQNDTNSPAIWILTYDLSNIKWPMSMSKYLDNQKGGHLKEIELHSPKKYVKSLKAQVDAYLFTHKLEYLGISNDEKIVARMKKFESNYK
jgi:hypothetical protein